MQGRILRETKLTKIPIIGKIKTGIINERGYPQSLDYFVATGQYENYFKDAFGDKPKSIEVFFLSDEYKQSCFERYELRQGPKLFAEGDGVNFRIYNSKEDEYSEYSIDKYPNIMDMAKQRAGNDCDWKVTLTLTFVIMRIRRVFGAWQLTTKGEASSIPNIVSSFDAVKEMAGTIVNIPFDLQVEKVVSQKPGSKSSYPVIKLIPNVSAGHLEKVRKYLESGSMISGLITEDNIDRLQIDCKEVS